MTPTSLKRDWRIHITYYTCIFCVYIAQVVQNNLPRCRISATTSPVRLFGIPISTFVPPCLSATVVIILGQNPKYQTERKRPSKIHPSLWIGCLKSCPCLFHLALHLCHMLLHSLECRLLPSDHCEPWLQLTQINTAGSPDSFPFCICWEAKTHNFRLIYHGHPWIFGPRGC